MTRLAGFGNMNLQQCQIYLMSRLCLGPENFENHSEILGAKIGNGKFKISQSPEHFSHTIAQ